MKWITRLTISCYPSTCQNAVPHSLLLQSKHACLLIVLLHVALPFAQDASAGFSHARWAAQLSPLLKQWDALMASAPASLRQAALQATAAPGQAAGAAAANGAGRGQQGRPGSTNTSSSSSSSSSSGSSPVDAFVVLERAHGVALVGLIDRALAALAGVLQGSDALTSAVQVGVGGVQGFDSGNVQSTDDSHASAAYLHV